MSGLRYKKDGSLDMRYSSSKAASSGSYSGGGGYRASSGSGNSSSYSGAGSGYSTCYSDGLHYKKDGSLDMRYSSSKAVSSGLVSGGGGSSRSVSRSSNSNSELKFKKDGSLDMRHSSSKAACGGNACTNKSTCSCTSGLHYKKDGSLDMRFSSSQDEAVSSQNVNSSRTAEKLPMKKDGTPDLRFKSSQINRLNKDMQKLNLGLPDNVPLTKAGYPDMRTTAAKQWVQDQASKCLSLPEWIPRKKDGSLDASKSVADAILNAIENTVNVPNSRDCRRDYYAKKMDDHISEFRRHIEKAREEDVDIPEVDILKNTVELKQALADALRGRPHASGTVLEAIPSSIPLLDYKELKDSFADEEASSLGRGAFGVVFKGTWKGQDVAVKRLHLPELTKQERTAFIRELLIIDCLGKHPNLVALHGYTLDPPCLIMEFVELGSLHHLLYICEDVKIEAKMTDGRIKKRLVDGIVNGMIQLHSVDVVHADLNLKNVVVSKNFVSKITDFGLSRLRVKTTSSIASNSFEDGENVIAGTAAYMAPELLESAQPPAFPCDVYSFGILLNEVLVEEEPYSDQYQNFRGRGLFAAANYARLGNRPFMNVEKMSARLKSLIEVCWSEIPVVRPTFQKISTELRDINFPDSF